MLETLSEQKRIPNVPAHNPDIAQGLDDIADLLELQDANPFRVRAYRNAARILGDLPQEARLLVEKGDDLTRLPGIGSRTVFRSP